MFANKAQERFILNSKKKKEEEKKKTEKKAATPKAVVPLKGNVGVLASQKVSSQKPTTPKATATKPVISKTTAEKQIQQQKLNYNLAQNKGDYLGKRLANTAANTVRTSAGIPLYSSAVGDRQAALTTAKGLTGLKQNLGKQAINTANRNVPSLSANHPLNRAKTITPLKPLTQMFDGENYEDKFKRGNIGGGVASLVGETIQLPQTAWLNLNNNISSVLEGKGLQPYQRKMNFADYEKSVAGLAGVAPISTQLSKKNPMLGGLYSTGMDIATDPLNLFDAAAVQTAKNLNTLGSVKYADALAKGSLVPTNGTPTRNITRTGETVETNAPRRTTLNTANEAVQPQKIRQDLRPKKRNLKTGEDEIYYHGSDSDWFKNGDGFELSTDGTYGGGVYLTPTYSEALRYANNNPQNVGKFKIDAYNILDVTKPNRSIADRAYNMFDLEYKDVEYQDFIDDIMEQGDSIGDLDSGWVGKIQDYYNEYAGGYGSDFLTDLGIDAVKDYNEINVLYPQMIKQYQNSVKLSGNPKRLQPNTIKTEISGLKKDLGADKNKINRTLADDIARSGELTEGIPKNTPYSDVSRHAKTIKEGGQYSEGTVKTMLKIIKDGGFSKFTKSNSVAVQNASRKMQNVDDAYIKFKNVTAESKHPKSEDIALGYQLAKHYDELGEFQKASEILEDTTFMLSETGRTLQAARLAMKNSPLGRQKIATKIAKKISDKTGQQVKLSDEVLGKLYGAKTEKEISEAFAEVRTELWNQVPPTFIDKFNAWRYTAMLGNLRTVVRNETGNAVSYLMKQFKDTLGTGIERVALKEGERTKAILTPKDRDLVKAGREIAKEHIDDLQGAGKYADINEGARPQELPLFGQQDTLISKTVGKGVEKWRTTTNKALNEGLGFRGFKIIQGDEGWLTRVYGDSFAKVLKANNWTLEQVKKSPELFDKVHEIAKLEAQRATFRDASEFATALNRVSGRLRNSDSTLKKVAGYGIEAAIPFKKTPVNILKRSLEYSPVGLVESVYKFKKAVKDGASMADAIDRLCAGAVGTGAALMGSYLASQDLLTVTVGNDKEGEFEKLQGEQAYALNVNVGGKDISLTLDWLVPSAVPLFLGAEMYNSLSEKGASTSDIINSLSDIADPVFEMSMLQGISNLIDTNSYGDGNVASTMGQMAGNLGFSLLGQTVPTLSGQFARTIDPIGRRSNSSDQEGKLEKYVGYNLNKNVISKIPVLNQKRQEYVDQWGRTQEKKTTGDYIRSGLENFISPSYTSDRKTTEVDKQIAKVYSQNKNGEILPPKYNKYDITFKEKDYRMNSEQMEQYKKTKGQYAYSELDKLFKTDAYRNMSVEDKEKAIKNVYDESTKKAKSEFLKTQGVDESEIWLGNIGKKALAGYEATNGSISPEDYYKQYYQAQKGYSSGVGKAMAIMENGNAQMDTAVLNGMDISRKTTVKAQRLLDAGITADEYSKIRKEANTDGESLTTRELLEYIRKNGYSDIQRRAILSANRS